MRLTFATQEASTRRVKLDEENPISVDLALKYIYGRGERRRLFQG